LKTTYYLRALGATSAEKSTINTGALNAVKPATVAAAVAAPVVEKKPEVVAEEEGFLRQRQYQWRVQSTIQIAKLVIIIP
jgi:hypothetical protein